MVISDHFEISPNDRCSDVVSMQDYNPLIFESEYSVRKANKRTKHKQKINKKSKIVNETSNQNIPRNSLKIDPRTPTQREYLRLLNDMNTHILFGIGPAGSGKSFLAAKWAAISFLQGVYDKIVIVRPAVCAGENLGFLPGDLKEKMTPLLLPILDTLEQVFGKQRLDSLINLNKIEFAPLAYMRGRTFTNSVIILDEAQNIKPDQLLMVLTRLGEGSKIIVTGDVRQTDLKSKNGLVDFMERFTEIDGIEIVNFSNEDIVRHHLIGEILKIYDE